MGRTWDNLTADEQQKLLGEVLGSERKYGQIKVWIPTIIYSATSITGIPGNILTLVIIFKSSYMKTPSKYFIFNLAIVDLITLIFVIPMEIVLFWKNYPIPLGKLGCDIATVVSELMTYVSILTLIVFTIERYVAICLPLRKRLHFGKRRTIACITVTWMLSLVTAYFWTLFTDVIYVYYHPTMDEIRGTKDMEPLLKLHNFTLITDSAMCMSTNHSPSSGFITLEAFITIVLYLLPILLLPVVHTRMSNALKESHIYQNNTTKTDGTADESNITSVLRMQRIVFVCFLVCWTPHHVQRIFFIIVTKTESWSDKLYEIQETLHLITGCSYLLHSAINPFLYSISSKRFRHDFFECIQKKGNLRGSEQINTNLGDMVPHFDGENRKRNRTKIIGQQALIRHFDYDSESSDDNYIHLERDKVIYHRNKSKQITIFKKRNPSPKSMPSDKLIPNSILGQHSEPHSRIQRNTVIKKRRITFSHCSIFEDEFQTCQKTAKRKICSENV